MLLDKMWDDVVAGPQPDRGLGKLRKISTKPLTIGITRADKTQIFNHQLEVNSLSCIHGWYFPLISVGGGGETSKFQRSISMPASPGTPTTPVTPTTPASVRKDNVWRSVFHPGSNLATKGLGAQLFDKPQPNSPTVYDWYINWSSIVSYQLSELCMFG